MESLLNLLLSLLQITLIDIVLSGDNMGVIALSIRNLPKEQAKMASILGVFGAICMRIVFASIITKILTIKWIPIKLIGGLLLLKISWNLLTIKNENEINVSSSNKNGFWASVYNIILADISMSLDNALAIGGIAKGNIMIVAFGLLLNIPIMFFGSQLFTTILKKSKLAIYIGLGILVHTALDMTFQDSFISPYIFGNFFKYFPIVSTIIIVLCGYIVSRMEL